MPSSSTPEKSFCQAIPEIADKLEEAVQLVIQTIQPMDRRRFEGRPEGKWSAGQQLAHLNRAIRPLLPAYRSRRWLLKMVFGKPNRPSRSYEDLRKKYQEKLEKGAVSSRYFLPPVVGIHEKDAQLQMFQSNASKLIGYARRIPELSLDQYHLPHPILGRLTLREMLFFTIFHIHHHLEQVKHRSPQ
jgi:hypothetical protein